MYKFEEHDNNLNSTNRSLKERANSSLKEVKESFLVSSATKNDTDKSGFFRSRPSKQQAAKIPHQQRITSPIRAVKHELSKAVNPRTLKYYGDDECEEIQSHIPFSVVPEKKALVCEDSLIRNATLPSAEEAAQILKNQAQYVQQIETENKYIKEELMVLHAQIGEIQKENDALHHELKTTVIHEIMLEGGDNQNDRLAPVLLYTAKIQFLESQLQFSRTECSELKQKLGKEPIDHIGSSGDIFMLETEKNLHQQSIDRMTKERDQLLAYISSLEVRLKEMAKREEDTYQQMKKGIELVESAQLEQTEALVQKEQLTEELNHMRDRFEAHVFETQTKMESERESARMECKLVIEGLNAKLKEVTERFVLLQNDTEKSEREKHCLSNELADVKSELRKCDKEATMASEMYRSETMSTTIHRSTAMQDAAKLRVDVEKLHKFKDEEKRIMKSEVDDLRRRLQSAERELLNSKEECIHLTTNTQALERELHLAKLSQNSVQQSRMEDLKAVTKHAQQRENELNSCMAEMEDKHSQTQAEMDKMLNKQNKLILKLRDECRKQAAQLGKFSKKHRSEVGHFSKENEEVKMRLDRSLARLAVLDDQSDQHSRVHEKLVERLKMMDEHSQHQAAQIMDVLAKQSRLMRDRQLLAREVEFLRKQFHQLDTNKIVRFSLGSSSQTLVDEILNTINSEDKSLIKELVLPINIDVQ